jgi:hypothetical protein
MTPLTRYRILNADGDDLGQLISREPAWAPGSTIHRGPHAALEVLRIVESEPGADVDAYLLVQPA